MPRIALVVLCVLGGCSFEADYGGGIYRCSDNNCPAPLVCEVNLDGDKVCRSERMDAAVDGPTSDALGDAATPLKLNCDFPYPFATDGGMFADRTNGRSNKVAPTCFNTKMNGPDAVHIITPGAGRTMIVRIDATFAATAYVLSACGQTACNGNVFATPGSTGQISVYTLAGPHYIVVDSRDGNASGEYTLTVEF